MLIARRRASSLLTFALTAGVLVLAPTVEARPRKVAAATLLAKLDVVEEQGWETYRRAKFRHWTLKRGLCDTRDVVLISESTRRASTRGACSVTGGRWVSVYDGKVVRNPRKLEVDHRVALAEAWSSGARTWSRLRRQAFANDTGYAATLVAVTSATNQAKGSYDPSQWEPARNKCAYAAHWVAVKYRWNLTVDAREHAAIADRLSRCGAKRTMVLVPAKGRPARKSSGTKPSGGAGNGSVAPVPGTWNCPSYAPIKGNRSSSGDWIYHVPGAAYYKATNPEECFRTEADAVAAGYRRAKV